MRPGDLIEFVYAEEQQLVVNDELCLSDVMYRWCPIGSNLIHTCVALDGVTLTWLNEKGLFHASVDETCTRAWVFDERAVVPRTLRIAP